MSHKNNFPSICSFTHMRSGSLTLGKVFNAMRIFLPDSGFPTVCRNSARIFFFAPVPRFRASDGAHPEAGNASLCKDAPVSHGEGPESRAAPFIKTGETPWASCGGLLA